MLVRSPLLFVLCLVGCWSPRAVVVPAARVHASEDAATEDDAALAVVEEPALNVDPDGLDPYIAVTVTAPLTMVDDGGKPVAVLNSLGAKVEVRVEDGGVRRKVWCSFCAPPTEGWVRTEDIALARAE